MHGDGCGEGRDGQGRILGDGDDLIVLVQQVDLGGDGVLAHILALGAGQSDLHHAVDSIAVLVHHAVGQFGIGIAIDLGSAVHDDLDLDGQDLQNALGSLGDVLQRVGDGVDLILAHIHGVLAVDGDGAGLGQLSQNLTELGQGSSGGNGQILIALSRGQHDVDGAHQLANVDRLGQFVAQSLLQSGQQAVQIVLQNDVAHIVLAVDDHIEVIRVVGVGNVDKVLVAVVGDGGIQQIELHVSLLNQQQAGIHGDLVVGIGHHAQEDVCTDFGISHIVVEGQGDVLRQVLQQVAHAVDHLIGQTHLHQLVGVLLQLVGEVLGGNAGGVSTLETLGQDGIQPSGEVDIGNALDVCQTDAVLIAIHQHSAGNDGGVGLQTGHGGGRLHGCAVTLAVVNDGAAGDGNLGLGGSDGDQRQIVANGLDLTLFVVADIADDGGVDTGVDRCAVLGLVQLGVGLHAVIEDLMLHDLAVHADIQILGSIVEGEGELVLCVAAAVHQFHIGHIGNDDKGTDNRDGIVQFVAEVGDEGHLGVSAAAQSGSIQSGDQVALLIQTEVQVLHQLGGGGVQILQSGLVIGGCAQIDTGQKILGEDAVFIVVVEVQIDLSGLGLDDQVAHVKCRLVVGVSGHGSVQINTDIGGQVAADGDLDVAGLGDLGDGLQGRAQSLYGAVLQQGQVLSQLAQGHGQTGAVAAGDQIQHILQFLGQAQLDGTVDTGDAVGVHIQIRCIQTDDKLDVGIGDVGGVAIGIAQSHIGGQGVAVAIVDVHIGHVHGSRCLGDGNGEDSLAGLIGLVASKLDGDLVGGVGDVAALKGVGILNVQRIDSCTGDGIAACIGGNSADGSKQFLVGVVLVHHGDVVALDVGGLAQILQRDGLLGFDVHDIALVGDLQQLVHSLAVGIVVAEVVSAVVQSGVGDGGEDTFQFGLCGVQAGHAAGDAAGIGVGLKDALDRLGGEVGLHCLLQGNALLDLIIDIHPQGVHVDGDLVLVAVDQLQNPLSQIADVQLIDVDGMGHGIPGLVLDNDLICIGERRLGSHHIVDMLGSDAGHAIVVVHDPLIVPSELSQSKIHGDGLAAAVNGQHQIVLGSIGIGVNSGRSLAVHSDTGNIGVGNRGGAILMGCGSCRDGNGCAHGRIVDVGGDRTAVQGDGIGLSGGVDHHGDSLQRVVHTVVVGIVDKQSGVSSVAGDKFSDFGVPAGELVVFGSGIGHGGGSGIHQNVLELGFLAVYNVNNGVVGFGGVIDVVVVEVIAPSGGEGQALGNRSSEIILLTVHVPAQEVVIGIPDGSGRLRNSLAVLDLAGILVVPVDEDHSMQLGPQSGVSDGVAAGGSGDVGSGSHIPAQEVVAFTGGVGDGGGSLAPVQVLKGSQSLGTLVTGGVNNGVNFLFVGHGIAVDVGDSGPGGGVDSLAGDGVRNGGCPAGESIVSTSGICDGGSGQEFCSLIRIQGVAHTIQIGNGVEDGGIHAGQSQGCLGGVGVSRVGGRVDLNSDGEHAGACVLGPGVAGGEGQIAVGNRHNCDFLGLRIGGFDGNGGLDLLQHVCRLSLFADGHIRSGDLQSQTAVLNIDSDGIGDHGGVDLFNDEALLVADVEPGGHVDLVQHLIGLHVHIAATQHHIDGVVIGIVVALAEGGIQNLLLQTVQLLGELIAIDEHVALVLDGQSLGGEHSLHGNGLAVFHGDGLGCAD